MSTDMERRLHVFGEELAAALGALAGHSLRTESGPPAGDVAWFATFTSAGDPAGELNVRIDTAGIQELAGIQGDAPEESGVSTMLRDGLSRAADATATREAGERLVLTLVSLAPSSLRPQDDPSVTVLLLALRGPLVLPVTLAWRGGPSAGRTAASAQARDEGRLDVLLDIDLPVVVRFGHTQMPIRALSRLGPGSVIELGRSPDDPVEVLVSNRVVAHGEVVIVGGNYGIRILDVTSRSERARSMEE